MHGVFFLNIVLEAHGLNSKQYFDRQFEKYCWECNIHTEMLNISRFFCSRLSFNRAPVWAKQPSRSITRWMMMVGQPW